MRHYALALLALLQASVYSLAQEKTDPFLRELLLAQHDSLIDSVLLNPGTFRYQVIYTRIDRDKKNIPSFNNFYVNVDRYRYFNPASMVKMPLAFLSLEKFNQLQIPGLTAYTSMLTDSSFPGQTRIWTDRTSENGLPSIAHYIKKALLISDNDAYNRMYEWLGQGPINRRLHDMGYGAVRITRRFVRATAEQNRRTNSIRFVSPKGALIYHSPAAFNTDSFDFSRVYKMGTAHYNTDDSLVQGPFDFTTANNMPLEDMVNILRSVMFPNTVNSSQRFNLTQADYRFLYRYLSQYPSETDYPRYDSNSFYDSYVKFYFRDTITKKIPPYIRVFNKVGWAYGCLTDVSYVADFRNNVEYMLAVTIYVNSDNILNDDRYDYETVGWPFMYKVGQVIYDHELKRKRKFQPDLSAFQLEYRKQTPGVGEVIRDADN